MWYYWYAYRDDSTPIVEMCDATMMSIILKAGININPQNVYARFDTTICCAAQLVLPCFH